MFGVGIQELLVICLILLIMFGGKKLPELMRGLGEAVSEFKKVVNDDSSAGNAKKKKDKK